MILNPSRRALLGSGMTALFLCAGWPAMAAQETLVEGVFALPDGVQTVAGEMVVRETGPLRRELQLVYTDLTTGQQISDYDVELTQQLHILAADAGLTSLVHRHVEQAEADGAFLAQVEFPAPGVYHIYTDAVPSGRGQQVMRFDVTIGAEAETKDTQGAAAIASIDAASGPVASSDGDYTVMLDSSQLRAGAESLMTLSVKKNGEPARDLAPYLGVAAHAVFVRAEDLAYVHAHAMAGTDQQAHDAHRSGRGHDGHQAAAEHTDQHGDHSEMAAAPTAGPGAAGGHADAEHGAIHEAHSDHAATDATQVDAARAGAVSPEMILHVTPPAPGTYALWIEFIGGEEVLTVPFRIKIPEPQS